MSTSPSLRARALACASLACVSAAGVSAAGAQPTAAPPRPSAAATAANPPAPRAATARAISSSALENGLHVIVAENHAVPMATATLVLRAGAMTQTPDDAGVPHLFEHMLFKGYRGMGDRQFGSAAAELKAGYNGTTGEELVTYYLTGPSASAGGSIELLGDLVRSARFDADDLRTERFVVLGEMQRGDSDPAGTLRRAVARALWGDAWHRKNTVGEAMPLLAVTPARLREIYGRYYVPNNAALVVTGDVNAERVLADARRHFGGWRRRADPFAAAPVPALPPLAASQSLVVTGPVATVTVMVQWQGPSVGAERPATYAADVLSEVVNDEQSAFTARLVDAGYFQAASFNYHPLAHTGPISFVGVTTADKLAPALTLLATEIERMGDAEDYFEPSALQAAAGRRRVDAALEAEAGPSFAHTLGYRWGVAGLDYHREYDAGLAAQRPADLRAFVKRYMRGKPFVIGALVPPDAEAATAAMLKQYLTFVEEAKP